MLRLALQGLRGRKGPFAGAFVALAVAAALVMACGTLLQAGLQADAAGRALRRRAGRRRRPAEGEGQCRHREPGHRPALRARAARRRRWSRASPRCPASRRAIADVADAGAAARPATAIVDGPGGHPTAVHPWATAALTPYALQRRPRARAARTSSSSTPAWRAAAACTSGTRVRLASNGPARAMTVVGIAATSATRRAPGRAVRRPAPRPRGSPACPGRVDAIGVLPAPGTDSRRAARPRARRRAATARDVVTGADARRGRAHRVDRGQGGRHRHRRHVRRPGAADRDVRRRQHDRARRSLQREREVALLRAVAATPRQVRRMIAWEALLVGLLAAARRASCPAPRWRGALGGALSDRGIAPEDMEVTIGVVPVLVAVAGAVLTAHARGARPPGGARRASRPRRRCRSRRPSRGCSGVVRLLGGLLARAAARVALLAVAGASQRPRHRRRRGCRARRCSLVLAVAFLGPVVARLAACPPARPAGAARPGERLARRRPTCARRRGASPRP